MDPKTLTEVLDLLSLPQAVSRNRNLSRFSGETGLRLWRLYRVYLSLLRDLRRAADDPDITVKATANGGGLRVEVYNERLHWRRINDVPQALAPFFRQRIDGLQAVDAQ